MTTDELFPIEAVSMDSPRLVWVKAHNVITYLSKVVPPLWYAGIAEAPGFDPAEWFATELGAWGDSRCGTGATEDEAIAELAFKHDLRLWNEGDA